MIDKTKSYRFKGDSERWEWKSNRWEPSNITEEAICASTFEHLHFRGILLEYPALPSEDWEFCEFIDANTYWIESGGRWAINPLVIGEERAGIYCRKKKPVYQSGCCAIIERTLSGQPFPDEVPIYWTTDPDKGKELLK